MEGKRILIAVDGSTFSDKVMEVGIEYARLHEAEVVFVYCHKKFPKLLGQPYRDKMITAIRDEAEEVARPYLNMLTSAGVHNIERLMEGPAGAVIPEVADEEKCDLIVTDSGGLSNLQGLIIGSVIHRVLHMAKCPVLVVK